MIYRSNIQAPDLRRQFATTSISQPRSWSFGHDVLSDAVYDSSCGFMTDDESAILYECANRCKGVWVDIGSRLMWTTAHIAAAGCGVMAVDPEYHNSLFAKRALSNAQEQADKIQVFAGTSREFFIDNCSEYAGFCIDGNHDYPEPRKDARNALRRLGRTGVIVLHDFWGRPIRDAVEYLFDGDFKFRVYDTPNGMAVCWRGDFVPPDHIPDPSVNWAHVRQSRCPEFDFQRCS